jgi:hypothetical protein
MKLELLQDMIDAHRYLRHDFKNDLQVILGYLQIGQMEKAYSYARKTADRLEDYNSLGKCKALLVQSYLLSYVTLLSSAKEYVHLRIEGDAECWLDVEMALLSCLRTLLDPLHEEIINGYLRVEMKFLTGPAISAKFICTQDRLAAALLEKLRILNKEYQETLNLSVNTEANGCVALNISKID